MTADPTASFPSVRSVSILQKAEHRYAPIIIIVIDCSRLAGWCSDSSCDHPLRSLEPHNLTHIPFGSPGSTGQKINHLFPFGIAVCYDREKILQHTDTFCYPIQNLSCSSPFVVVPLPGKWRGFPSISPEPLVEAFGTSRLLAFGGRASCRSAALVFALLLNTVA